MTKLKQAFCIFFLMCMFQSLGQSFRVISGKIIGNKNNLYLSIREGFTPLELKNNTFKIRLPKEDFPDYVSLATISGTKVKHLFPKIWIEKDSVNIVFNINGTDKKYQIDKKTSYQDISEKIENASSKQERKELIKQNINLYPAIFFLYKNIETFSLKELEALYLNIPSDYKKNVFVERIGGQLEAKKYTTPKIKDKFISFTSENKNKEKITIETAASKYRLLAFVSYGCYFSRASIPVLAKLHKKYSNQVEFITIWDTHDNSIWQDKELSALITWTDLWDKKEFAFTYFDIDTYPTFYLINKNGEILGMKKGNYKKVAKLIRKHLK